MGPEDRAAWDASFAQPTPASFKNLQRVAQTALHAMNQTTGHNNLLPNASPYVDDLRPRSSPQPIINRCSSISNAGSLPTEFNRPPFDHRMPDTRDRLRSTDPSTVRIASPRPPKRQNAAEILGSVKRRISQSQLLRHADSLLNASAEFLTCVSQRAATDDGLKQCQNFSQAYDTMVNAVNKAAFFERGRCHEERRNRSIRFRPGEPSRSCIYDS
ncbi:MAG: hypothetical protein HETSPECPRED_003820 [Heterodermia speciosa]|uniref:Uncharacterized protein n=1 Tax=Heterodermia speciosa TaxID=116794 RepID=A0A8H3FD45_9LECA|nr:MAG: hypothetical protein HETSPECPRED_003820 [Heterodermia speciosa]